MIIIIIYNPTDYRTVPENTTGSPSRNTPPCTGPRADSRELPVYSSRKLFGGTDTVIIEHGGVQYLLRRTRQGKLLLTK